MKRTIAGFALAVLVCAGGRAATVSTNLSVTATASINTSGGLSATGTANLTGGIVASGTFTGSLSLTTFSGPYTITLSGGGGTITGTLTVSQNILAGSGTASATVTGGTGPYAGATGSFPNLTGTGSFGTTGAISLTFSGAGTITTGGGGPTGPTPPAITDVLDAGSYTKNIAQGSIFVIKGTNMSASGFTQMSFPLPTTSGNVKITFTPLVGGTAVDAYLVYLYNQGGVNQLAAVLPSNVAAGNYNVTVTYNGTASSPFLAQVVQRKLGLITADSSGSGLAVIQNFISQSQLDIDRFTTFSSGGFTFSPSKPGQVLIAWATGMGPVTGGDNTASPGFDFTKNGVTVNAVVGGMTIPALYAGRAPGLAGADQINFQLPANVPTGCTVSFQVSVNGVLSNPTFIAIADGSAAACTLPGYTTQQLQSLDQGGSITTGGFSITQFGLTIPQIGAVKSSSISGGFVQLTGFQLGSASQVNVSVIQSGSCQIIQSTGGGTGGGGNLNYLDAGTVTVTGPAGSGLTNQVLTKTANSYGISTTEGFAIPGQLSFTLPAGTYSLNGGGGPDVGSFNTSQSLAAALTVTGGLPSSVNRSTPLTINWTGGNASDQVEIVGSSSTTTGTGASAVTNSVTFICITTVGAGTFTVPTAILSQLPASTQTSPGILEVASGNANTTFTASLPKIGGSVTGNFSNFVGTGAQVNWQ